MSLLDVVCIFGDSLNKISGLPFYLWILDVCAQVLYTDVICQVLDGKPLKRKSLSTSCLTHFMWNLRVNDYEVQSQQSYEPSCVIRLRWLVYTFVCRKGNSRVALCY